MQRYMEDFDPNENKCTPFVSKWDTKMLAFIAMLDKHDLLNAQIAKGNPHYQKMAKNGKVDIEEIVGLYKAKFKNEKRKDIEKFSSALAIEIKQANHMYIDNMKNNAIVLDMVDQHSTDTDFKR